MIGKAITLALANKQKESNQLFKEVFSLNDVPLPKGLFKAKKGGLDMPKKKGDAAAVNAVLPQWYWRWLDLHVAPIQPLLENPRWRYWI